MRHSAKTIILLGLLGLSACNTVPPSLADAQPSSAAAPQTRLEEVVTAKQLELAGLLEEVAGYRTLPPNELNVRGEALRKAWSSARSEENRLRLAAFYALAPAPHGDRNRAIVLLDVTPGETNGRGRIHPIAAILLFGLQENRRLDEALNNSQQKLRDETRRADAQQQTNEQLQKKLDAIREIERKMLDRNTRPQ
ncbi:MAG: hypothetical protein FWD62_14185 [Betaproteobacteria bacterium]|nr:hypothetical protein [Betaproteobacteria bacterium]